jgi:hypothetical protein
MKQLNENICAQHLSAGMHGRLSLLLIRAHFNTIPVDSVGSDSLGGESTTDTAKG